MTAPEQPTDLQRAVDAIREAQKLPPTPVVEGPRLPPSPSGVIICYSKCGGCQFGEHDNSPHTWMDSDDLEHAIATGRMVDPPPTSDELAVSHPCGCWCNKPQVKAAAVEPVGETP